MKLPDKKNKNKKLDKRKPQKISDPLEKIELDDKQKLGVLADATTGAIASSIPIISKLYEWTERIDQASHEEKLKTLLIEHAGHFESIEDAISKLKLLTATRGGQTLFRKVIQIVDKGTEDIEWIRLLAITLKNVTEAEFDKYFDAQMFVLSQIDRLSPQALILLSQYNTWKEINIQGTTTTSGQTMGDWIPQATMFMRRKLSIDSLEVGARINHSFRELETAGIINLSGHQLKLTAIGIEIHRAII